MPDRLVDAIKEGVIITIPESQARQDDLFILRVHEKRDLVESLPSVESRRRSGRTMTPLPPSKSAPKWHSYQSEYKKNNVSRELIDNFQWEIGKARKARNLTRLQLANALGVPEPVIKMLEHGELPSDDFVLINKLQQYLGINIRKDGKTFEAPLSSLSSRAASKPDFTRKDLSLSDLQKMKEARDKPKNVPEETLSGDEIRLFD